MNVDRLLLNEMISQQDTTPFNRIILDLLTSIMAIENYTASPCKGCPLKGTGVPHYSSCIDRIKLYYLYNRDICKDTSMLRAIAVESGVDPVHLQRDYGQC